MNPVVVVTYIGLCAIVGLFGRERALGFGGAFLFAVILTPVIVAIMLLLTQPKH
jgi:Na+-translocating ferredoxin:NAD+ oxidoreductase RnfA subunit